MRLKSRLGDRRQCSVSKSPWRLLALDVYGPGANASNESITQTPGRSRTRAKDGTIRFTDYGRDLVARAELINVVTEQELKTGMT